MLLTDLALATYPDGSTPEVTKVVRTATFLFAAGQETTARLLATALKHLAEHPPLSFSAAWKTERASRLVRGIDNSLAPKQWTALANVTQRRSERGRKTTMPTLSQR